MNEYILLYKDDPTGDWSVAEGEAQTEVDFLEQLDNEILSSENWVVYETVRATHKEQYVHSGEIDGLLLEDSDFHYTGFFRDYPDELSIPEEQPDPMAVDRREEEAVEEAQRIHSIFEKMVLARVQDKHGEEWAAVVEYFAAVSGGGGFWNDPLIDKQDLSQSLAQTVATRAVHNIKGSGMVADRDYILQEAGLKDEE